MSSGSPDVECVDGFPQIIEPWITVGARNVILYFETWAEILRAEVSWHQDPSLRYEIHGCPFEPQGEPTQLENALDENPAAGHAA